MKCTPYCDHEYYGILKLIYISPLQIKDYENSTDFDFDLKSFLLKLTILPKKLNDDHTVTLIQIKMVYIFYFIIND